MISQISATNHASVQSSVHRVWHVVTLWHFRLCPEDVFFGDHLPFLPCGFPSPQDRLMRSVRYNLKPLFIARYCSRSKCGFVATSRFFQRNGKCWMLNFASHIYLSCLCLYVKSLMMTSRQSMTPLPNTQPRYVNVSKTT